MSKVNDDKQKFCQLGDVATYVNGYAFKPADWGSEGLPIIRIQDLTGNSYQANYFSGEIDNRFRVYSGDILISWSASLGVFEWQGGDAVLNQHIFKVVFNKMDIDKKFFIHQLKMLLERFASEAHGATMKHLTRPVFNALPFYAPSLSRQQKIASVLERVSNLITLNQQQLSKFDQLAKSRFIEMFGDPVANPKGWSIKKIKEVVAKQKNALKAGPFGSALKKEFYTPSGYKIYGQEQVINGDAEFGDYYISQEKYAELKSCAIQAKDVLISLVGTYGKTLVIPDEFEPGIINPRLIKITFDQSVINVSYFQAYFSSESLKAYLDVQTHGCTMGVLNLGIISNLLIPLPPLSLQNEFAAFIEQLDKSKVTIRKSIEKLETTYRALLQEYFG